MIELSNHPLKIWIEEQLNFYGGTALLLRDCLREGFKKPHYWGLLSEQIYQIGVKSFPLVLVTSATIGMVMSLQFGFGLEKFGGKPYVPRLVASTIFREIGPMFTSLMLAARVGAGMASEIGSMVVTQQIDAIRALGTSPIKKIVLPRILACLIILPLLVAMANVIGNIGGLVIGVSELGLDSQFYYRRILDTANIKDYLAGFSKTFFFSLFISVPSCYYGLTVKNGTQEVGMATRKAVVTSSLLILIGDFFLGKVFWMLEKWL
jgi:phospholipid/cholesterol/gamma-HCH transport system permease protein